MPTNPSSPPIEVKLSYNIDKTVPRNLFVHVHNVPEDAQVQIEYRGNEVPATHTNGYVRVGFWISENEPVRLSVRRGETFIAETEYLVHAGKVFERANQKFRPHLTQIAIGIFG
ncbi:hypothetical protein KSC_057410 [Ktedonobacter sp. SOSP1-52]|uniref:hypothetical protein n=1 Tax=Ktedonobacter sp. SOSP1-52 TaxID=2778366 RepID=UPI0019151E55|nr:hypothetical protein [Ktedonobacter sp. SOSP1-52]GHO66849.1 hypothetical protein KSC_057410 [Ktedonobacter sp. SOSP1-52]